MDASLFWNLVGLASLVLSICALVVSASAKKAVRKAAENAIQKKDLKEDSDRLHQLIASLVVAKDIAMRRQRGAPPHLSVGQDPAQDLHHLRIANDQLVTRLPAKLDSAVLIDTKNASSELSKAIQKIQDTNSGRDGWKDALATLQILIPRLEQEERRQANIVILDQLKG